MLDKDTVVMMHMVVDLEIREIRETQVEDQQEEIEQWVFKEKPVEQINL